MTQGFFSSNKRNPWLLFAACVLFNVVLAAFFRAPYAYPDEYGVFANGNWMFGGVSWDYKPPMYYGYTFSPFVGLLMQFFDGIRPVYIGSLCIKAVQLSFIPVLCYKLLDQVLGSENIRMKMFLSSIACLYPSIVLYSKYVSNETTLHLTLFLCLFLIGKCAVEQRKGRIRLYSALLGFFVVFAYATHGMGLAFIVAVCFTLPVAHFLTRKRLVSYPVFIAALALSYFLDSQIKAAVMDAVYTTLETGAVNTMEFGLDKLLTTWREPGAVWSVIHIFLARLLYMAGATFGTFYLAVVAMLVYVCGFLKARFTKKDISPADVALFTVTLFCFAIFLCGLSLSSLANIQSAENMGGKMFFYGRYYEYMGLPLIMVGFHYLFGQDFSKKRLLCYSGIVMVLYVILSLYIRATVIPITADETTNYFFTLGIVPYIGNTSVYISVDSEIPMYINLYTMALFTLVFFSVMMYLIIFKNFRRMAIGLLLVLFMYGTIYDLRTTVLHLSVANYDYFYAYLEPLRAALDEYSDVYDAFPNLYVVSNSVGSEDSPSSLTRGRPQLAFFNYSVADLIRPHQFLEIEGAQSLFANAILVSDEDMGLEDLSVEEFGLTDEEVEQLAWEMEDQGITLEDLGWDGGYQKIYESETAHIWIRGKEIKEYFENRP